jgi:hypothetical protein
MEYITLISTTSAPSGFAVTATGARAIIANAEHSPDFVYNPINTSLTQTSERVLAQSGFSVGYFTCGNKVLNSSQFTAADDASYSIVCKENGVIGQAVFESTFVFTTTDAENYAYLHGPSHCADLTDPIAETIADLPPYSCSRTIHPSFLACFATAAANTQLLFQVLVFVSALALSKLAARYPPKQSLRSEAAPHATPYAVEMTAMNKTTQEHEKVQSPLSS